MKTSEKMQAYMRQFESCKLAAYQDDAGVWTIGYGHTGRDVHSGRTVTIEEANSLFSADLSKFESGVAKLTAGKTLRQCQFDALVSFSFNVGLFALKGSTLLYLLLKNPDDRNIYDEFLRWDKSNGHVLSGLTKRRRFEAEFYFGKYA
jgi:lysozyme